MIIGNARIEPSCEARDLGVTFDHRLQMSMRASNIRRSAVNALTRISQIRRYLDNSSTEKLVQSFISSNLDYCNSLLYGLPDKEISKVQRIQNSAAKLVTLHD